MVDFPKNLTPTLKEIILLPSGKEVEILKATPIFKKWKGKHVENTYGGKAVLEYRGEPVFAELRVLRGFQDIGWDGVWVDDFSKKYRVGYWGENINVQLPVEQEAILNQIRDQTKLGYWSGCWDVLCWKGKECLFAEMKRKNKDQIRDTQLRWLEVGLGLGIPLSSFLIVEWSIENEG